MLNIDIFPQIFKLAGYGISPWPTGAKRCEAGGDAMNTVLLSHFQPRRQGASHGGIWKFTKCRAWLGRGDARPTSQTHREVAEAWFEAGLSNPLLFTAVTT
jgi:hypothetical protein